jgi:hypothetical protein
MVPLPQDERPHHGPCRAPVWRVRRHAAGPLSVSGAGVWAARDAGLQSWRGSGGALALTSLNVCPTFDTPS